MAITATAVIATDRGILDDEPAAITGYFVVGVTSFSVLGANFSTNSE